MIRRPVFLVALALAGCSGGAARTGPSLLPRDIEGQAFDEPAAAPVANATADPALDTRIATLVAAADATETAFKAADRRAAAALAAGARARVGSDTWLDAQTGLAALDEQRALMLAAVTDLERIAIERAAAGQPPYPALEAARTDADAALDRIGATVAARKAELPLQ